MEKYAETSFELAHFRKSSQSLRSELGFLIEYGIGRLDFGMYEWKYVDKKPSFTPNNPPYSYGEKNLYVNAANNLWYHTMRPLSFPELDERYYRNLLHRIKEFEEFEKAEEFAFNKGIVYANLGVAQSAYMKIDEGFANILKALIEDRGYSEKEPEYDLYRRDLFTQFEDGYVKVLLQKIISQLNVTATSPVEKFVNDFLDSLNDDQRAFFDCTFARIAQNREIWEEKENSFTANRLLAYTQDFCLFNEDFLKSRIPPATLSSKPYWELRDLIDKVFHGINLQGCGANTMADLDKVLSSDIGRQNQPEKCLRILLTIRNYSSHNVSGGTSANLFYARYKEILSELVRAMCHIRLLP